MVSLDSTGRVVMPARGARGREHARQAAPSAQQVPLTAEERQCYQRIPGEVPYVPHPSFGQPDAEERLLGQDTRIDVPTWVQYDEPPEDVGACLPSRCRLSRQDEKALFLRYNYARYRLSRLVDAQRSRYCEQRAREMVHWFCCAQDARADLVQANMGLVLAMAKRSPVCNVEFAELVSEGNMALLRSVEKFDVSRGFKFSTYACRAILKSFGRLASKCGRYRQRFPTEFEPDLERSDYDVRKHEMQAESSLETLREVLARNHACLSDLEQRIVWERFAIHDGGRKRTLTEVGRIVGLSNERVRQIQFLALRKIRAALEERLLPA